MEDERRNEEVVRLPCRTRAIREEIKNAIKRRDREGTWWQVCGVEEAERQESERSVRREMTRNKSEVTAASLRTNEGSNERRGVKRRIISLDEGWTRARVFAHRGCC
jgi:hypothetical protein